MAMVLSRPNTAIQLRLYRSLVGPRSARAKLMHSKRCSFCSSSSSPPGHASTSKSTRSGLNAFAHDWNSTLARHPQSVLATFLSTQSTTWLGLYACLSAANVALPPSLAAGWVVAKFTKKFRQPIHAALAAMMVQVFPTLSEIKVTPLVTGIVMGDKDKKLLTRQLEEQVPNAMPTLEKIGRGAKWLEGPVDKYGLSYYLSSRITGASTVGIAAYLVHHGVDVGAYLSTFGGALGEGIGEAAGTAAAASMLNLGFLPLQFYMSVYGVRALESGIRAAARGAVDSKLEAESDHSKRNRGTSDGDGEHRHGNSQHEHYEESGRAESEYRESEYERVSDGAMKSVMLLLLTYTLVVSLYSMRLMKETATAPRTPDGIDDEEGEGK